MTALFTILEVAESRRTQTPGPHAVSEVRPGSCRIESRVTASWRGRVVGSVARGKACGDACEAVGLLLRSTLRGEELLAILLRGG